MSEAGKLKPSDSNATGQKTQSEPKPPAQNNDPDMAVEQPEAGAPGAPPPLAAAPLAYENPSFLNGPDGRLIRIVAEYMEPLARFRREHVQDTVVFFGSSFSPSCC